MDYTKLPKIELHCHIDGSLDIDTTLMLLKEQGREMTKDQLIKAMSVDEGCTDLMEYLQKFDLPLDMLQSARALEESTYAVVKNAALDGVKYFEGRFAPTSHRKSGMKYHEIIEAVLKGMKRAEKDYGIYTGLIACAMRGLPDEENLQMFNVAREYLGEGLVAADLAGNEAAFPASDFTELFDAVDALGLPFTLHAGECGSPQNVADSIAMGAARIGHGVACVKDTAVLDMVAQNGIGLEICPTSNLQTKAFDSIKNFPVMTLMDAGIKFCINTDNRTVSGITLSHEYELLSKEFGLTETDFDLIYKNAVDMAFCNDEIKEILLK